MAKTNLDFVPAVALGALCNALVCLAVWLSYGAHTTTDKMVAIVPPITAFVAAGFEHSVANMYFVSIGLLIKGDELAPRPSRPNSRDLTWGSILVDNLLPVTIGNVVGGALMVGAVYWFVYLRRSARGRRGELRSGSRGALMRRRPSVLGRNDEACSRFGSTGAAGRES